MGKSPIMELKHFARIALSLLVLLCWVGQHGVVAKGMGQAFQDKFCNLYCSGNSTQPRLTLTDDQISTLLKSDEIVRLLEANPDILNSENELENTCVIEFNRDQRDIILNQYGVFFSSSDELDDEWLYEPSIIQHPAEGDDLDENDRTILEDFMYRSNRNGSSTRGVSQRRNRYRGGHNRYRGGRNRYRSGRNRYRGGYRRNYDDRRWNGWRRTFSDSDDAAGGNGAEVDRIDSQSHAAETGLNAASTKDESISTSDEDGDNDQQTIRRRHESHFLPMGRASFHSQRASQVISDSMKRRAKKKRSAHTKKYGHLPYTVKRKRRTPGRKRRGITYIEVCEPVRTYEPLALALTPNGDLVQLPQFPEVGLYQWFLKETCKYNESLVVPGVSCVSLPRTVEAVFVHLVGNTELEEVLIGEGQIMVESCDAVMIPTEEVGVENPTTSQATPSTPATSPTVVTT